MKQINLSAGFKRWALVTLITLITLTFGWVGLRPTTQESLPTESKTTRARSGDLVLTTSGEGTLEQVILPLGFSVSGTLTEIVQPGQLVRAGEILASLDSQKATLEAEKAALAWNQLTSSAELAALSLQEQESQLGLILAQQTYAAIVIGPEISYYQWLLSLAERDYWNALQALAEARASTSQRLLASVPRLKTKFDAAELALEEARLNLEWALNYQPSPTASLLAEGKLQAAQSQLASQTNALEALKNGNTNPLVGRLA